MEEVNDSQNSEKYGTYEVLSLEGESYGKFKGTPTQIAEKGFTKILLTRYPKNFEGEIKFYVKDVNVDEDVLEFQAKRNKC